MPTMRKINGQTIDADTLDGSHLADIGMTYTVKAKPDDQIVNNSETLVNDEDLVIPVGANDVWLILVRLFVSCSNATPDMDWLFTVPSGGEIGALPAIHVVTLGALNNLLTEKTIEVPSGASNLYFHAIYTGGGTAGNLQLEWAQNVATVADTKMLTDSSILALRIK